MYVPLGELLPGMGYLVRRLLENTSNESFLRHTFFEHSEVCNLLKDPSEPPTVQTVSACALPPIAEIRSNDGNVTTSKDTVACNLEY
jgi:RHH-type proline utilization regulon transcriptional repressor/proline dehydrogenase/delta 1-pyrroline-5-carboxylate dehydrogenase